MEVEINKNILGEDRVYNLLGHVQTKKVALKDIREDASNNKYVIELLQYSVKHQLNKLVHDQIIYSIDGFGCNPKMVPAYKTHSYRKIINHEHFVNLNIECFYNWTIKNKYLSQLNNRDGLYIPRTLYSLILSIGIIINFSDIEIGFHVHRDDFCNITEIPNFIYEKYQNNIINDFIEIRDACILAKHNDLIYRQLVKERAAESALGIERKESLNHQEKKELELANKIKREWDKILQRDLSIQSKQKVKGFKLKQNKLGTPKVPKKLTEKQARCDYLRILKELSDFHNNIIN